MPDPSDHIQLGVLLERRRLGLLSGSERDELEALFDREPGTRALGVRLDEEEEAMNETITAAVEHFDFEKARRAIDAKLASDRTALRFQMLLGAGMIGVAVALAWSTADWWGAAFTAVAVMLGVLGWLWVFVRQHTLAMAVSGDDVMTPEEAYRRHRGDGRTEFTILRALVLLGGLGFVILMVDSVLNADYLRALVALLVLVVLGPSVARRMFTRAGIDRQERFLAEGTGGMWTRGGGEPR